jgi:hypothetical protein
MTNPDGDVYYLAICRECQPILPQPFDDRYKRDEWASDHSNATRHNVLICTQDRHR